MHARQAAPNRPRHRTIAPVALMLAAACSPPALARDDIARGQQLLAQYQCGACHAIPGVEDARGGAGPPLNAFGRRIYIAGHVPNTMDRLVQWISAPRSLVPNTTMPDMGVSERDARAMAAYLHGLK
jgi:cytochrome c2